MYKQLLSVLLASSFLNLQNVYAATDFSATIEYIGSVKSVTPMTITVEKNGASTQCQLPCDVGSEDSFTNTTPDTIVVKMKLETADQAELTLTPKSKMHFENQDGKFIPVLDVGVTHVEVPETTSGEKKFKFFIKTKSATMGVRGTEFVVQESESGETQINTLKGEVGMAKDLSEFNEEKGKSPKWTKIAAGSAGYWSRGESRIKEVKEFNRDSFRKQLKEKHPSFMKAVEKRLELQQKAREVHRDNKQVKRQSNRDGRQERRDERRENRPMNNGSSKEKMFENKKPSHSSGHRDDIKKVREQYFTPKFERKKDNGSNYLQQQKRR
ncbi:MAG: FecR domain-containing protein [Xanthomonadaceae bacterium]|nr:FecR domain-containing protein [Xanthomonadaceae bacterium]